MLLLETFETVGGVWLALSAIGFILGAAFVKMRQDASESALESIRELLADGRQASPGVSPARKRQLEHLDTAMKRPKPSADLVKAA